MRLTVSGLRSVVKRDLPIEFAEQDITSYGGLELLRRYVSLVDLHGKIRHGCRRVGVRSDYGVAQLVMVVLVLLVVGARRVKRLKYVSEDPLVLRLCGLSRLPSDRTVVRWLKQFTDKSLRVLIGVNSQLLYEQLERLGLNRLTVDVDGTVISTGQGVSWAFRGFNPHHRKNPSYYPLLFHIAQTGQILRLRNRPGNVHDSRGAQRLLGEVIGEVRGRLGRSMRLEFRMDAAFFQKSVLERLEREGCEYAVKVGFWQWLGLKSLVASRRRWTRVNQDVSGFEVQLPIEPWEMKLRVAIYRRRVAHKCRKNFQLDLFSPDDGHYEYSAVCTNKTLSVANLWYFAAGRGAQEKTLAELRGELALDVVPTNHYGANSAWQQLNVLTHNLLKGFQLDTVAEAKPRSRKQTYSYRLQNVRTLRFLLFTKAGRLVRTEQGKVLRLGANPQTQKLFEEFTRALAA